MVSDSCLRSALCSVPAKSLLRSSMATTGNRTVVVQKPVVKLHVPVPGGGFIDAEVPATVTLTLRKDGDVMELRISPEGSIGLGTTAKP